MDTRSERRRQNNGAPFQLVCGIQLDELKSWLCRVRHVDRPKFIFMGSVIAPLKREVEEQKLWMREDGVAGYPRELDQIARCILEHQVPGVVFVSGDLHLSYVANLELRDKPGSGNASIRALQIVSSGLYAPLSFINTQASELKHHGTISLPTCEIEYSGRRLGDERTRFVKVDTSRIENGWKVSATPYDCHGAVAGKASFEDIPLRATEPLPCTCPVANREAAERV